MAYGVQVCVGSENGAEACNAQVMKAAHSHGVLIANYVGSRRVTYANYESYVELRRANCIGLHRVNCAELRCASCAETCATKIERSALSKASTDDDIYT
jgi:NAD-dependent dihydropyrimidine dehydrogenase PreA subunit